MDRRSFLGAAIGSAVASARVFAQGQAPAAVSPVPMPRNWGLPGPIPYPDPDIIALDPRFQKYIVFNSSIKRLHIGTESGEEVLAVEHVIICAGQEPVNALAGELGATGRPVHVIGGALLAAELDAERAIREGVTLATVI